MARAGLDDVRVEELMSGEPITIGEEASVGEAAGLMLEAGVRHLPVVDANGVLVGMVSERDLRERIGGGLGDWPAAASPSTGRAHGDSVRSTMTPDPLRLAPGSPVIRAVELFVDDKIGAVPVVDDDDRVLGILSYVDVLRWVAGMPARTATAEEEAPAAPTP